MNDFLHEIDEDIKNLLDTNKELKNAWDKLTPLARNEWICWVTIVKKEETKNQHLVRLKEEILNGKKRPCCWPWCPHRNPKTAKYFP